MSSVATVAAIICVSAIVCSFISVVVPDGPTKKVMNIVLGVFILCTMIAPVKNAIDGFNYEIQISDSADSLVASADEAYNDAVVAETKSILESNLKTELSSENINVDSVNINMSVDENGGIYINTISIYILKKDEFLVNDIISVTKKKYEVKPEVIMR